MLQPLCGHHFVRYTSRKSLSLNTFWKFLSPHSVSRPFIMWTCSQVLNTPLFVSTILQHLSRLWESCIPVQSLPNSKYKSYNSGLRFNSGFQTYLTSLIDLCSSCCVFNIVSTSCLLISEAAWITGCCCWPPVPLGGPPPPRLEDWTAEMADRVLSCRPTISSSFLFNSLREE